MGNGKTTTSFDYSGPLTEAVLLGPLSTRFPKTTLEWNSAQAEIHQLARGQPVRPQKISRRLEGKRNQLSGDSPMCLAIPGKILEAEDRGWNRVAKVQFGGVTREVYLDFVPEAGVGDYVLVHVGFAVSKVDEAEARRTYELLEQMGRVGRRRYTDRMTLPICVPLSR